MILQIASVIIFLFVSLSLFFRTACPLGVKVAGSLLVLIVSMKYAIYHFLGGAFFSPELPRYFLLVMEALYGSLIMLFFLLLLFDLYLAGNWILGHSGIPVPQRIPKGAIKCGLVGIALCLGIWGTWESVRVPTPKTVELHVPNLPQGLEGTRIVQLSDLHIGPLLKKDWLAEVVQRTNALKPDIIAMTGDYVDGHVNHIAGELSPLADLNARYGVYGVTGNHEYYWNATEWIKALEKLQVNILNNEHKTIAINDHTLVIAGIPDLVADRYGFEPANLPKALYGAPESLRLLLSHQPKNAREYLEDVDIQLSGHTHGGLMFFLRPLIARFNNGFVSNLYADGGKNIYVSPGTGLWNGFSSRIGVPSEITLLVLKKSVQDPQ